MVGGSGNWDGATQNWTGDAGATNGVWAPGANATFGGTAGAVTVAGTQDVGNITVQTGGYQLTGGALTNISPGITVAAGATNVTVGTNRLQASQPDWTAEIGFGGSIDWQDQGRQTSLYGEVTTARALSGGSLSNVSASAGLRVSW